MADLAIGGTTGAAIAVNSDLFRRRIRTAPVVRMFFRAATTGLGPAGGGGGERT